MRHVAFPSQAGFCAGDGAGGSTLLAAAECDTRPFITMPASRRALFSMVEDVPLFSGMQMPRFAWKGLVYLAGIPCLVWHGKLLVYHAAQQIACSIFQLRIVFLRGLVCFAPLSGAFNARSTSFPIQ